MSDQDASADTLYALIQLQRRPGVPHLLDNQLTLGDVRGLRNAGVRVNAVMQRPFAGLRGPTGVFWWATWPAAWGDR